MFKWIKDIANQNTRTCLKPNHRPLRASRRPNYFRPRLEVLEDRLAPATVNMYWDPTSGANASTTANWDTGSLGSGTHPAAAPGNTAGEKDQIYFDGTAGKGGNQSCTWDYTPTNPLGEILFQNGWTQTLSFNDKQGFKVSGTAGVSNNSAPTLAPNGNSGANAVAAITLTNGALFNIEGGCTLNLTGWSTGDAIFFAGDGTAGEYIANGGTVTYTGTGAGVDYVKIPVLNGNGYAGIFNVNGGAKSGAGSTLQVSGTDSNTNNVSFYMNSSGSQANIYGGGTLWCYNNFTMTGGQLQTTDGNTDTLQVGTSGSSPVDGTANVLGGYVEISLNTNSFGKLQIVGTTKANVPIVNVGSATLEFDVTMVAGNNLCSQLIVGNAGGTGKVNFGYNGGTTRVQMNPEGNTTTGHKWQVIFFGSATGTNNVMIQQPGYTLKWNANNLEIDN